jgi:hypothetical protein
MEDGCNETCSGVLAWGSWDKAQDTLGRAMSFSLRSCAASIIDDDW